MKAVTCGALGILAVVCFGIPATAQSSSNSRGEASSLSGTSLVGIDNRSAQDDFASFFGIINSGNATGRQTQNSTANPIQFNQTLTLPDTPVYLQPAQQSLGGNDGVQVQVDLTSLDRPKQK